MVSITLQKIKPLAKIGVFLSVIILIFLFGFAIFTNNNQNRSQPQPTPNQKQESPPAQSSPLTNTKLAQKPAFEDELANIKSILPYSGPNYKIEYTQALNTFNVKIQAQSAEEYLTTKKSAEDFIKSKGVGNICALNIFWVPQVSQEVRKSINPKDLITTGCTP